MRGKTEQVKCACGCGVTFTARTADIKRGWGRFASKRCKAVEQTRRTGKGKPSGLRSTGIYIEEELGWDAHKDHR